jgi:hypothetical protein
MIIIFYAGWICALQVDAGRRQIWITPCKPQAQLGVETVPSLPELRSSSTRYGVEGAICMPYPELRFACTGLSTSDAFRHQIASVKQCAKLSRMQYNWQGMQLK